MKPAQIILTIAALGLTVLLFTLPKSVIKSVRSGDTAEAVADNEPDTHTPEMAQRDTEQTGRIRSLFENEKEPEKKAIFADSLADLFETINRYDSSAKYRGYVADVQPAPATLSAAGDAYYQAFNFAGTTEAAAAAAEKVKEYFAKALAAGAPEADAKAKMAMAYVMGPNPMEGITMLREVNAKYPDHRLTVFNLGLLAIRSGQYERAVERFEVLVKKDTGDCEAWYYLAASASEAGMREKALMSLKNARGTCSDPMMLKGIESMQAELNKIQ